MMRNQREGEGDRYRKREGSMRHEQMTCFKIMQTIENHIKGMRQVQCPEEVIGDCVDTLVNYES